MESEKDTINNAMQFLLRADLKGQEVPAFNNVMNWLESLLKEENVK